MASSEKRCHYEVLGLKTDCTADEIRSAYKKLVLQRHPDKLIKSCLSEAEATASFQELVSAYEVLSDPKERSWYDSHRSQILFSNPNTSSNSNFPDLFSYFSNTVFSGYSDKGKGFYKVYSDVFDKIYANEINFVKKLGLNLGLVREAPAMGNLESDYSQASAFYNYWLGFITVMDFFWVGQYDVNGGPNRKSRRLMEEENKKLRKKAKREYNETVRGLAEFVKKRDKRVIDMQVKKGLELERKREEEKERRKQLEREKLERAKAYEEPEWAKVEEEDEKGLEEEDEEDEERKKNEFYCVVCGKKFKSEKQWKNHEQSKKHKEKVAEFRDTFTDEDDEEDLGCDADKSDMEDEFHMAEDQGIDGLEEELKHSLDVGEDKAENEVGSSDEEGIGAGTVEVGDSNGKEEDDIAFLEAMLSGRKNRKKAASMRQHEPFSTEADTNADVDGKEFMEYDNRKSTRRNRGTRRDKGKKMSVETTAVRSNAAANNDGQFEENDRSEMGESTSQKSENNVKVDHHSEKSNKISNKPVDGRKEYVYTKPRNASTGKKSKATAKNSSHPCDTCGEDFESRNRLHKHLGETGHASLKYR